MPPTLSSCRDVLEDAAPPDPESLSYSVTLPAALGSPALARTMVRTVLRIHGLADLTDPAVQAVGELTACACQFASATEVYLSLRYRDGALRLIVHDTHPRHVHPRLSAACDARRRSALRLLACVVRASGGEWGFGKAREPGGGTRMWAVLPREGGLTYAKR